MKHIIILSLLFLQACTIGSGENSTIEFNGANHFPKMTGIDLQGKTRKLPQAFDKKINIVVVAFKREQQIDVDSWIPVADKLMKTNSNIGFYEIPLIYELGSVTRSWINNGMRRGVKDEIARARTITVYTKRERFFEIMKMKENNIYVLLVDQNGKILWKVEGAKTKEKVQFLKPSIDYFLKNKKSANHKN